MVILDNSWSPEDRDRILELLERHPEIAEANLGSKKLRRLLREYLAAEGIQDAKNGGKHSNGANRAREVEGRYQGGYSD